MGMGRLARGYGARRAREVVMQRLFEMTRDGRKMVLTAEQALEELLTDMDAADPGDPVTFPEVRAVVMSDEEYEQLAESDGW